MYRSGGKAKDDDEDEDDKDESEKKDEVPSDEEKFHYLMTCRNEENVELPKTIILKNPYPRESPVMKKRRFPSVLRFSKAKETIL